MAQYLRKAVVEMKAYTPGEQINNAIKLNTNECAWGPAEAVLKAVAAATPDQLRLYPSPMADRVREAAADVFKVPTSQVLVGNGSDDCLTVVMRSFLSPGEKCACPWPTYSLYDTLATIQGVDISHTDWLDEPDPLLAKRGVTSTGGVPGYNLPISALLASGAKVVFVATPNNPSATLVPLEQLDLLAAELKGILVIDEAYIDYATKVSALDRSSPEGGLSDGRTIEHSCRVVARVLTPHFPHACPCARSRTARCPRAWTLRLCLASPRAPTYSYSGPFPSPTRWLERDLASCSPLRSSSYT